MINSSILQPNVFIYQNGEPNIIYKIKYITKTTVTLQNISTNELTTEPTSVVSHLFSVANISSENKW